LSLVSPFVKRYDQRMATRPRDRRAQIIAAAADQFHRVGYHRVGTGDIAAAVGITAGALYRHFRSKQELLGEIILDRQERLEATFSAAKGGSLDDLARALTTYGLDYRDLGVLWQRESRHLPTPERDKLRHRGRELAMRFAHRIQQDRPELTDHQAELLAWSVFAVVAGPSHNKIELPRPRFDELLASAANAALAAPVSKPSRRSASSAPDRTLLTDRASRREVLLDAAVELFARDGFAQVTMEEIGAAVGIAGPSIYNHFTGKPEILDAAITRGTQWLQFLMTQTLSTARTPVEASETLLRNYTEFVMPHSALVEVLLSETHHLPDDRRHAARRAQHEFLSDWIRLLRSDRPDADPTELRAVVLAELAVINNIARTQHLAADPNVVGDLVSICSTIQRAHR
jgi:AcrR family transcriptional regulator